jgi:hypothetical protein
MTYIHPGSPLSSSREEQGFPGSEEGEELVEEPLRGLGRL